MLYDITLRITHSFGGPAAGGRHVLRIVPRDIAGLQTCLTARTTIEPAPGQREEGVDFFGNPTLAFGVGGAPRGLVATLAARVLRLPAAWPEEDGTTAAEVTAAARAGNSLGPDSPVHYLAPSPRVAASPEFARFAQDHLTGTEGGALEAALALSGALHRHMTFDPRATEVDTPPEAALALRRGVCQDMAHILIGTLRAIGLPAGYVSGFLRTRPPPGRPRLQGADAMHAWVRVWCGPRLGWVELDPTNDCLAGQGHVTVAHGRDYSDVAPVKGVLRLAGAQSSRQEVDMVPVEEKPA